MKQARGQVFVTAVFRARAFCTLETGRTRASTHFRQSLGLAFIVPFKRRVVMPTPGDPVEHPGSQIIEACRVKFRRNPSALGIVYAPQYLHIVLDNNAVCSRASWGSVVEDHADRRDTVSTHCPEARRGGHVGLRRTAFF
jgi:hypothetical protein